MAPKEMPFIDPVTNCAFVYAFFAYFVNNVSATVSYDQKELLNIRTATTQPMLDEYFFFNELDGKDLLQTPDKTLILVIHRRKRRRYRGRRSGCLVRIRGREDNLPLPSILLANVRTINR
jgi:hypothetical protein